MADIIRRDPFGLNSNFRQAMERFFDDPFFRTPMGFMSEEGTLALDISEAADADGKKAIVVKADLPGFKKEEVDVQMHDGVLSISARHGEEHEEKTDRYYRRERSWGALTRRVALPGIVKDAPVEASLKDGVLSLRIPLPEQAGPKQIEIKGE
ncbi:MAG: Hsp20/alpha crystallin family protein [Dehalococcoidia bacterium]